MDFVNNRSDLFDDFEILSVTYKIVHGHNIITNVLYPKSLESAIQGNLRSEPRPVMLRYHGGGLIGGSSLLAPFFNPWFLELAQKYSAVIVSPNYRLLPESSVADILEDIEDHWTWVHRHLPEFLAAQTGNAILADLSRIIIAGDSAAGYLSIQTALSHPRNIRSVVATYPSVILKSDQLIGQREKQMLGLPAYPKSMLADRLALVKAHEAQTNTKLIVTDGGTEERLKLMFSMCQHGLLGPYLDQGPVDFYPLERLDREARFPPGGVLILHGRDDTVVPVEESYLLKKKIEEVDAELPFRLIVKEGDHGFDHTAKLDDDWLCDSVKSIVQAWLA